MKAMITTLRISVVATIVLTILVSFIYPVAVWGAAQALFPDQANGSLVEKGGKIVGSTLIGQTFSSPQYFHTRPSAAGKGYDATASGGSNLGPLSEKLLDSVRERVHAYRKENGLASDALVPVDAVTASGSGLDPHISPRNAELQTPRVARERGLSEDAVRKLVAQATDAPAFGLLGPPAVNAMRLNLALDGILKSP
jgi:K+-transporting ATPase ATPase C chain